MKKHKQLLILLFLVSLLLWIEYIGSKDLFILGASILVTAMFIHEFKQRAKE